MINKPILARCDDRKVRARRHPFSGEPEEWLADTYLAPYGLIGLAFDFFVNWNTGSIPNQLWIKRIVDPSFEPWPITRWRGIPEAIHQCDSEQKVKQLCRFADRYGFSCHYFLFKESPNSQHPPVPIVEVQFDGNGFVKRVLNIHLSDLMNRIKQLRGKPFRSRKVLYWGLTSLECYLSNKTSAIWPGDADLVLVNTNFTPIAVIEFKKDTISAPISSETLSKYYSKDPKKYDSFAHFRDYFTDDPSTLPIIVLYYSVKQSLDQRVKLECIEGEAGNLRATNSELVLLPNARDEGSCRSLVESLLTMINCEV